ncbi:alpha-hydroxy acid oxidase [Granulosicoccus sp. 3-233]|uniref:alpha-hydroxy acid oxidase n=1 Tax=Granulosicoccus sp. 3-233 TaxID=3417969 RepID=UPI003D34815E
MQRTPDKTERSIPPGTVCLEDYQRHAKKILPHDVYEYLASGCADERTLARNRAAFDESTIQPRILRDCSNGNTECRVLGQRFRHPILLGPVAHQALVHEEAELATAEAASLMEACMVASTLSSAPMESIAARLPSHKWFQLYFHKDRGFTLELLRRAEAAGFEAVVVTVDAPVNGARNRIQRAGFSLPPAVVEANLVDQPVVEQRSLNSGQSVIFQGLMSEAPTWRDIQWLRNQTSLPILIKGVMHPDDALGCVEQGLQGVIVSNHGGRCLDTVPASIEVVASIRAAVGEEFSVLLDGGIRRGTDVFKALALGADAVLLGRPQVFALAVAGALGVAHMIKLLRDELEICMALSGCPTLDAIGPSALTGHY